MKQTYSTEFEKHEAKGRYVAECALNDWLGKFTLTMTETEITCPVDIAGTVSTTDKTVNFVIEVKERFKNEEQLIKYPECELRVDKFQRMLSEAPNGTSLLYMVLLNEEVGYIYNMKKLDWSKVTTFNWRIKQTQVDPNSPYLYYPTYKIPTELAIAKLDISEYCKQWN